MGIGLGFLAVLVVLTLVFPPQDPGEGSWRQAQGGVNGLKERMKEKRAEALYGIICQNKLLFSS